jgi:UDP-GlcNAc:undecaprenyl-phosphate GlcNAc-1-phosphate transferase
MQLDTLNLNIYLVALLSLLSSIMIGRVLHKSDIPPSLIDLPDKRKIHTNPTPLVGGITILFSMLIVIILFQLYTKFRIEQFIIFSIYFFFVGLFDDLFRWNYKKKLILQVFGVIIFISSISSNISHLTFISIYSDYKILNYIIIALWILFIINAFNFFDGVNFLAGSLAIVFFSSYAMYYYRLGENLPLVLTIVLIFSIMGFLVYNRAPAKMFLGDGGSMFLGFAIAAFPIFFNSNASVSFDFAFPMIVSFILISDAIFVIFNRIIKGNSPFKPDKSHLHHQFLNLNFRNRYIVLIIISGAILHSILAFFVQNIGLILFIFLLVLINIIFIIMPRFLPPLFRKYNLWGIKNIYDNVINYFEEK